MERDIELDGTLVWFSRAFLILLQISFCLFSPSVPFFWRNHWVLSYDVVTICGFLHRSGQKTVLTSPSYIYIFRHDLCSYQFEDSPLQLSRRNVPCLYLKEELESDYAVQEFSNKTFWWLFKYCSETCCRHGGEIRIAVVTIRKCVSMPLLLRNSLCWMLHLEGFCGFQ